MIKWKRALAPVVIGAAALVLGAGPASATSDVAWSTGASSSDGQLLGSINLTVNQGYCEALVEPGTNTIINGLVDCNADGVNAAAVVSYTPGFQKPFQWVQGTYFGGGSIGTVVTRSATAFTPPA